MSNNPHKLTVGNPVFYQIPPPHIFVIPREFKGCTFVILSHLPSLNHLIMSPTLAAPLSSESTSQDFHNILLDSGLPPIVEASSSALL